MFLHVFATVAFCSKVPLSHHYQTFNTVALEQNYKSSGKQNQKFSFQYVKRYNNLGVEDYIYYFYASVVQTLDSIAVTFYQTTIKM